MTTGPATSPWSGPELPRGNPTNAADDLHGIIGAFDTAGNRDRLFDQEIDLLEAVGYHLTLAGAQLLGPHAARIAHSAAAERIVTQAAPYAQSVTICSIERLRPSWALDNPLLAGLL
jgi:predicted nucleotidyltransferase